MIGPCCLGQGLDPAATAGHPKTLIDPLQGGPCNEDRPLQGIGRPAVQAGGHSGEQTGTGWGQMLPRIDQHETARAIGRLHLSSPDTALPHQGRLLVTGHPANGNFRTQKVSEGVPVVSCTVANFR